MARGDYAWYGDWMDDHYQPWIDLKKRTSDALSSWKKASAHAQSYLGGRTAGTQDEFEEAMRRYDASSAAHSKYQALTDQEAEMFSGAGKDKAIAAFDAWSNFKPESESEPEPTKPDFPYSGLLEPVESKDTGGGFIKNEDTGEVTNIGESKYHRIINEDGTGTIFPITDTKSTVQEFDIAWGDPEYGYTDTPDEKQYLKDTGLYNPEGSEYQFQDLLDSSPTPIPNVGIDRAKPLIEEALGIPDPDYIQDEGGRPAGTNTVPLLLRGIPEKERYKHWDNDPYRDLFNINKLPSSDETLIASADPSNLKINTDTDTDVARAEKQREVIDKNLGFGIARDWETTNNQLRDTSTNAESLFIDPDNLPAHLEMLDKTIEENTYTTGDKIKDFAKEFGKNATQLWRNLEGGHDAASGLLASWGQQTGLKDYTYDNPWKAGISDRELQRTAEATKAWADTLTRDQRVDLYNRQQAGERNRLTSDQYGKNQFAEGSLNEAINLPATQEAIDNKFSGQYNVLNNVQDVVWKQLPTGQIVPSGLRDNWQLNNATDVSAGKIPGLPKWANPLRAGNTLMRNIGRGLGVHDESNPNYAPQGYDPQEFAGSNTYGQYQGTMRMPTMLDFGKYTPKATYSGQGQQKFGKNLMGISSNLISPSTGGGSSAMKIQSANKKGFGY